MAQLGGASAGRLLPGYKGVEAHQAATQLDFHIARVADSLLRYLLAEGGMGSGRKRSVRHSTST